MVAYLRNRVKTIIHNVIHKIHNFKTLRRVYNFLNQRYPQFYPQDPQKGGLQRKHMILSQFKYKGRAGLFQGRKK